MPHFIRLVSLIAAFVTFTPQFLLAQAALAPPRELQVIDTPSDGGGQPHGDLGLISLR